MERAWTRRFLFVVLWLLAGLPGLAQAADAPGGHTKPDMFRLALDLGLWTLVVFLLLLFVLKKYAWGPMLEGLGKREQNIRAAIDEAQKSQQEAQRLREELKIEMGKANEKVRELMEEARRDAQRLKEEMQAQGQAELQANRERLHREIETAKNQAIQELWNQTAQLAAMLSSKVLQRQITPEDHRRLLDEALADMGGRGADWWKK